MLTRTQHVFLLLSLCCAIFSSTPNGAHGYADLRFNTNGRFKILQVADMHYGNGATTRCEDVLPFEYDTCNDLNTTAFVRRLIATEKPDLIVFSGDNIFGEDATDPIASMNEAFEPAIEAQIPWAAILGNHDQESSLSRKEIMEYITTLNHTLSQVYPEGNNGSVDGYGNYHLEVKGAANSPLADKSVLNLFLLDSGDYSKVKRVHGYGWIQESQKTWFSELSNELKMKYEYEQDNITVPSLVYFHIPLVETKIASRWSISGVKQESIGCAQVNSGFLSTLVDTHNPSMVFNGHDHVNDFCGDLPGNVKVCYGGGVGYHAYGKAGWARRARIVDISLQNCIDTSSNQSKSSCENSSWWAVANISTWKRLDYPTLPVIDEELLWSNLVSTFKIHTWWDMQTFSSMSIFIIVFIFLCSLFIYSMSWWPFNSSQRYVPLSRS